LFAGSQAPVGTGLSASGPVSALANEQDLQSCNYMLTDRPAAQPYVNSAEAALVAQGYKTNNPSDGPIGIYLSDDPLSASDIIVTVDYVGAVEHLAGVPAGVILHDRQDFAVIENKSTDAVVAVGPAPW
jgi:hypothetical protein